MCCYKQTNKQEVTFNNSKDHLITASVCVCGKVIVLIEKKFVVFT